MSTISALLTAAEFAQLPEPAEGSRQELVRGVVVTMPPPGFRHGDVQVNVFYLLKHHAKTNGLGRVTVESGVQTERGPDTVRGPDVAFWSYERLPADVSPMGYPDVAADLCVEVLSPGRNRKLLQPKVREYLDAGVRMVWLVDPDEQTVAVYRTPDQARLLHAGATLEGEEILRDFRCSVSDFFT